MLLDLKKTIYILTLSTLVIMTSCEKVTKGSTATTAIVDYDYTTFNQDVNFLKRFNRIVVLKDRLGMAQVAISQNLQGRVMTSSSNGPNGRSYGWINHDHFESKDTLEHINPYGGEERFWLGPEGGQYAIFFEPGDSFNLENWQTPPQIDYLPFQISQYSQRKATYVTETTITNYNNFTFKFQVERIVEIFERDEVLKVFELDSLDEVGVVGYRTTNTLFNVGDQAWNEETGMLSIWLLGMFPPSDSTIVFIPVEPGPNKKLGRPYDDNYFGKVPRHRLIGKRNTVFFLGDGKRRSKIGISALRAKEIFGSYDAERNVLTIIKYNQPKGITQYVNSKWELQKEPYKGDVINAYNDGPPKKGAEPLGPFYELETSSPAMKLKPYESNMHIQLTVHFEGDEDELNAITQQVFNLSLSEIKTAFKPAPKKG